MSIHRFIRNNQKLHHENKAEFMEIFAKNLSKYLDFIYGFDVVMFDKDLRVPDGTSTKDFIKKKYGIKGVELIERLIGGNMVNKEKQVWEMTDADFENSEDYKYSLENGIHSKKTAVAIEIINKLDPIAYIEGRSKGGGLFPFSLRTKSGHIEARPTGVQKYANELRIKSIKQALVEGKLVPPEVLADYPELKV